MAIPLEKESKMWGLFYASDFNKLMFSFIADAVLFMVGFTVWGLVASLVLFLAVAGTVTLYFVLKSFWPEQHLSNILRYRREPKFYAQGREESEVES